MLYIPVESHSDPNEPHQCCEFCECPASLYSIGRVYRESKLQDKQGSQIFYSPGFYFFGWILCEEVELEYVCDMLEFIPAWQTVTGST